MKKDINLGYFAYFFLSTIDKTTYMPKYIMNLSASFDAKMRQIIPIVMQI